jgi:hypothetical protein
MAEQKLSAEQRLANFNIATKQSIKPAGVRTALVENTEYSLDLIKSRYLANTFLRVQGTITATHASLTSYTPHEDAPFSLINRVVLDMNDGFLPMTLTGKSLWAYNNTLYKNAPTILTPATSGQRKAVVQGLTASSGGTANTIDFTLQLPNTINRRDGIGLILLQGAEQLGTIKVTMGAVADIAPAASGFTFALSNLSFSVYTESFTVPYSENARPDTSVLKQVLEKVDVLAATENTIKLPVAKGMYYRKIGFTIYNATPARQLDSFITSDIRLLLNQNDNPYQIKPQELARRNTESYGAELPTGQYVFDFADQGLVNMAGTRDYLETDNLTELWLQFTTSGAGTIRLWSEQLHLESGSLK